MQLYHRAPWRPFLRPVALAPGLIAGLLALALLAWPLAAAPAEPAARGMADWTELVRGDPASDMVALTFDAGSVAGGAERVLQALRERQLHVTVFVTGRWVEGYPDLAAQLVADGHELANHTYDHPDLTRLDSEAVRWQLERAEEIARDRLGRSTRPWFRPPFGARNARVLDVAAELGFRSVYWTLDSGDWRADATAAGVLRRVLANVQPGDVVVHHLAALATAEALPAELDALAERGLRVVTVAELVGLRAESGSGPCAAGFWPERLIE